MNEQIAKYEEKMQKTINVLMSDLGSIRAGRANPTLLDKITVDYYGTQTPIQQIATVAVAEARMLTIQPYDASSLKNIEKAIQASDLGINPTSDGRMLRLAFPPLTEERRRELNKNVARMGEDSKVAIRSIRRDANDKFKQQKNASEITEDDCKLLENEIQKSTDKFCKDIDEIIKNKEKEIMEL